MDTPTCPDHPNGRVRRNGYYGKGGRYIKWQCVPDDDSRPHMVRPVLSMRLPGGADGCCLECQRTWRVGEGIPAARGDRFTLRDKASALMWLAQGHGYREAAQHARLRSGDSDAGARSTSREGRIAAEWLSRYAPLIIASHMPDYWPDTIVLDHLPFKIRDTSSSVRKKSGKAHFSVLGALAYDDEGPRLWNLAVVPGSPTSSDWRDFFTDLQGAPNSIVCDRETALAKAIRQQWPATEVYPCVDHFRQNVEAHLLAGGLYDLKYPAVKTMQNRGKGTHPFSSVANYEKFSAQLDSLISQRRALKRISKREREALDALERWRVANEPEILRTASSEHYPISVGALENELRRLKGWITERRYSIRNLPRLELLLKLTTVERAGYSDERRWAEILHDYHLSSGGQPAPLSVRPDPMYAPKRKAVALAAQPNP